MLSPQENEGGILPNENINSIPVAPVVPEVPIVTPTIVTEQDQPQFQQAQSSPVVNQRSSALKYFFVIAGIILAVGSAFGFWKYQQMKSVELIPEVSNVVSTGSDVLSDGQHLTEIVKDSAKTDMTPEEYKEATSFKVTYPGYGVTLISGQTYTVTWIAGKMAQASSYQVRLTDSTYQFDTILGTADQLSGKFSFIVPNITEKQYEKYKLVFSNVGTVNNSGGVSDYFYIKNISTQASSAEKTINKTSTATRPTATLTVNGLKSINVKSGDRLNYVYSSTNADSFSGTKTTSGCLNPSANEAAKKYSVNSGSGEGGDIVSDLYLGCTIVNTFTAKNTKTLEEVTATVSVTLK